MITRLYVDNYKALVNFELRLPRRCLFLGPNGSGKTAVFEAVDFLRWLMMGTNASLPAQTLTRWQTRDIQRFELDARIDGQEYRYSLEIEHRRDTGDCRIKSERLDERDQPLFAANDGKAQLYRSDGSKGPEVLFDWNRSALPILSSRPDSKRIAKFVDWMIESLFICRINPASLRSDADEESTFLSTDLSNFADWWRRIHTEDVEAAGELRDLLAESLPGFRGLEFRRITDKVSRLMARFGDKPYGFDELSDGQRVLIVLHALLVAARRRPISLFLDEPDNFVSIREIQPFFNALESVDEVQSVIISHHPTPTNLMAAECGLRFSRGPNAPVRVEPFKAPEGDLLTASEYIARGYFDEPA